MPASRRDVLSAPGWTPMPNWIFETFSQLDPVECKILLFVARRLYGYETPHRELSVRKLSAMTGLPKSTVHTRLNRLIARGVLQVTGRGARGTRLLDIPDERPSGRDETRAPLSLLVKSGHEMSRKTGRSLSAVTGHVQQDKQNKKVQVRTVLQNHTPAEPDLFVLLGRRLSPSSLEMIRRAYLGEREGRLLFSDSLLVPLRSVLLSQKNVEFVSAG